MNHLAQICIPVNEVHSHKLFSPHLWEVEYQHQKECFVPCWENKSFLARHTFCRWVDVRLLDWLFFIYTIAQLKRKEAENSVVLEKIVSDHFTSNLAVLLMVVCTGLGAMGMCSVMQ